MKYFVFTCAALGVPPLAFLLGLNLKWTKYAFLVIVGALCVYQSTAINFFSRETYAGSARGMEVSLAYLVAAAILGAVMMRRRTGGLFPDAGSRLYALYFLMCLPSLLNADSLMISWFEIWKMLMLYLFFRAMYAYLKATGDVKNVLYMLAFLVFGNAFVTAKMHYSGVYQPGGIFPHRNCMAMGMLLAGPVFFAGYLSKGLKTASGKIYGLAFVFAVITTLWSYSRGAIAMMPVAYGAAAIACLCEKRDTRMKMKRIMPLVLVAAVGVAAMLPRIIQRFKEAPESSGKTRVELAYCAQEMIKEHPFAGVGINNWSLNMAPEHPYQDRASIIVGRDLDYRGIVETVYLLVAAECGVPALLCMVLWFAWYWFSCFGLLKKLKGGRWYFIPAGLFGGLTADYLQSSLEWVLRQQMNLMLLLVAFALISYLKVASKDGTLADAEGKNT